VKRIELSLITPLVLLTNQKKTGTPFFPALFGYHYDRKKDFFKDKLTK
jgi:hypothetical protein